MSEKLRVLVSNFPLIFEICPFNKQKVAHCRISLPTKGELRGVTTEQERIQDVETRGWTGFGRGARGDGRKDAMLR